MDTIDTKTNGSNDDQGNTPTNRPTLEEGLRAANVARLRMMAARSNKEPLQELAEEDSFRNRHHIVIQVGETIMEYAGTKDTSFKPIY